MRPLIFRCVLVGLAAVLSACRAPSPPRDVSATTSTAPATAASTASPTSGQPQPDDGTWQRPAKDFASTRFSGLTQLTAESVRALTVKATFSTGFTRGHEA